MDYKEEILALKDGESFVIPESDYGKAEIWLKHGTYFLFGIPMYGGRPFFEKAVSSMSKNSKDQVVDCIVKIIKSWT